MPNTLFKDEDFNPKLKDTPWKKKVLVELEAKKVVAPNKIVPLSKQQYIRIFNPDKTQFDTIHMFMSLKSYGVFIGFYIKKGLIWGKDKKEIMTGEWHWPVFLHLLSTNPGFRAHFQKAWETQKMSFRLEGGPRKECIFRASVLDWGNILSVLNSWPMNMNCELTFEKFIDRKRALEFPNDKLASLWSEVYNLVSPIYSDIINYEK